jgi:hypothetical protein
MKRAKGDTELTPTERAKEKVGILFAALSPYLDARWSELVRGGWQAQISLPTGSAVAHVSTSGYYDVHYELNGKRIGCLLAGSFEQSEMAQAGPDRPVTNLTNETPESSEWLEFCRNVKRWDMEQSKANLA